MVSLGVEGLLETENRVVKKDSTCNFFTLNKMSMSLKIKLKSETFTEDGISRKAD